VGGGGCWDTKDWGVRGVLITRRERGVTREGSWWTHRSGGEVGVGGKRGVAEGIPEGGEQTKKRRSIKKIRQKYQNQRRKDARKVGRANNKKN